MANKKILLGILIVLVFGFTFVGCDNGTTSDTWSDVTSLSQLNGTWVGTMSFTETDEEMNMSQKYDFEFTFTINASAGTMSEIWKSTITFSGEDMDELWPYIKEGFEDDEEDEEDIVYTFDDEKYSVTMTQTIPAQPVTLADLGAIQINKKGDKIKISDPEDDFFDDMIFTKR